MSETTAAWERWLAAEAAASQTDSVSAAVAADRAWNLWLLQAEAEADIAEQWHLPIQAVWSPGMAPTMAAGDTIVLSCTTTVVGL